MSGELYNMEHEQNFKDPVWFPIWPIMRVWKEVQGSTQWTVLKTHGTREFIIVN